MSLASPPPIVSLRGVTRSYARPEGDVTAVAGIDLDIATGALIALTGPSGSGKSTLLHILGLLDRPTQGLYHLSGEDVSHLDDDERARRRNRKIGFVFQAFHLVPHLSLRDNVALPLLYRGLPEAERRARAADALARVGLGARASHRPDELSGGEQQRSAIARALVQEPDLLLADEPTGNLDEGSAGRVLDLFREIHADGRTVVLVTHNRRIAALAGSAYELRDGRLA